VDDSVHPADVVHLVGEQPGFGCAAEVADDDSCGARSKVGDSRCSRSGTGVQDNIMSLIDEDTGGPAAEPVG